jgi:hypothetical protein
MMMAIFWGFYDKTRIYRRRGLCFMHRPSFCDLFFGNDTMSEFKYELTPTMRAEGGWEKCDESEADQWSVYERDAEGLAVWVADFARKEDAINFIGGMQ